MSDSHRKYEQGIDKLVKEQGVTTRVANDVLYLRNQPHWSQQLEDGFIQEAKTTGNVPDVTRVGQTS